jgi:glutamate formiminotransferase
VGARPLLIAYNINLATDRLDIAKEVAAAVRASSGGLPFVKALGLRLADRGIVQVSINLTNHERTSMATVFGAVTREAERRGVSVRESEIIGLVPEAALRPGDETRLKLKDFTPRQVLETRLATGD